MLRSGTSAPAVLRRGRYVARPLTVDLVALDHEVYTASPDVIRTHGGGRWPVEGFTVEQDRELAARHQVEHGAGRSFAFLLLDPDERRGLGCVYLNPLHEYLARAGADRRTRESFPPASAMVTFWVRQDRHGTGFTAAVAEGVVGWVEDDWPVDEFVVRVSPEEHESCAALEGLGLEAMTIPLVGEGRAYRWFRRAAAPAVRRTGKG